MGSETAQAEREAARARRAVFGYPDPGKEVVGTWRVSFGASDFVRQFVLPAGGDAGGEAACEMTVIANPGPGRLILRYDFGPRGVIYAKLYPDDLAARGYGALKALWEAGFNAGSRYRVPEPLAFVPEHRMVVQRGVAGDALASALHGNAAVDLTAGSREAARWLVALHRCGVRAGEPESLWESFQIFRLMDKLVRAAATHPGERETLLEAVALLERQFRNLPAARPVVQSHGRFRHEHVFIGADAVSVIDLDQSRPADPARDAAEFLHALGWEAFKVGFDRRRTEAARAAFVEEYLSGVPEAARALAPCWSAFTLVTLLRHSKRAHTPEPRRRRQTEFLLEEMRRIAGYRL